MTSVLEMALEALEWADNFHNEGEPVQVRIAEAIAALKEAIKNQGEPVRGAYFDGVSVVLCAIGHEHGQRLYTSASTIPHGEPVGVTEPLFGSGGGFTMAVFKAEEVPAGTKLYAAPKGDKP